MRTRLTGLPFSTLPQAFGVPQGVRIKSSLSQILGDLS